MNVLAIIPARMGSSRFPGKPLMPILGTPMIRHVFNGVSQCSLVSKTVVATCDAEIFDYVCSFGGEAVMTANTHERASDRCAEALGKLEAIHGTIYDIVVMVQGDEPMVHPEMISEAVQPLLNDPNIKITNLLGEIKEISEFEDPNCIKVVCDLSLNALYFSREPIPTRSKSKLVVMGKQVCIIPFRRDFLLEYTKMMPSPLELAESIDMLRILEHGTKVRMVRTEHISYAVDTLSDLERVEAIMKLCK